MSGLDVNLPCLDNLLENLSILLRQLLHFTYYWQQALRDKKSCRVLTVLLMVLPLPLVLFTFSWIIPVNTGPDSLMRVFALNLL